VEIDCLWQVVQAPEVMHLLLAGLYFLIVVAVEGVPAVQKLLPVGLIDQQQSEMERLLVEVEMVVFAAQELRLLPAVPRMCQDPQLQVLHYWKLGYLQMKALESVQNRPLVVVHHLWAHWRRKLEVLMVCSDELVVDVRLAIPGLQKHQLL